MVAGDVVSPLPRAKESFLSPANAGAQILWQSSNPRLKAWATVLTSARPTESRLRALTRSPRPYPLLRREVQLLARLHVERGVPLVDVADGVGAELAGG